jgi:putative flippase GtrA
MHVDGERGSRPGGSKGLTVKYCAVSFCGLAVNIALLKLLTGAGLQPAYGQAVSLVAAVQATFWLNALFVFRNVQMRRWVHPWLAYMGASGLGLIVNYLIFNTLLSLHRPIVSDQMFAVCAGSLAAWGVNYTAARLVVFNSKLHRRIGALFSRPKFSGPKFGDAEPAAPCLEVKP